MLASAALMATCSQGAHLPFHHLPYSVLWANTVALKGCVNGRYERILQMSLALVPHWGILVSAPCFEVARGEWMAQSQQPQ